MRCKPTFRLIHLLNSDKFVTKLHPLRIDDKIHGLSMPSNFIQHTLAVNIAIEPIPFDQTHTHTSHFKH